MLWVGSNQFLGSLVLDHKRAVTLDVVRQQESIGGDGQHARHVAAVSQVGSRIPGDGDVVRRHQTVLLFEQSLAQRSYESERLPVDAAAVGTESDAQSCRSSIGEH